MVAKMGVEDYRIRLDGVRFRSRHGASASERRLPQDFVVHAELALSPAALPRSDDRKDVVDYDRIGVRFMTWDEWRSHFGATTPTVN